MPRPSRFTRLKFRLHKNATKFLEKTVRKSSAEEARACNTVDALSIASTKVGSVAATAVLNVIKAQAGASTTVAVARYAAEIISSRFSSLTRIIPSTVSSALMAASVTSQPLSLWRLWAVIYSILDSCQTDADRDAKFVAYRVRGSLTGSHASATVVALTDAVVDVVRAVTDIIFDYITAAKPTIESIQSVESLSLALMEAASQAANAAANAVAFVGSKASPS
ncbi:hypothetical protein F4818DRAFT_457167 [Hypoxylon cercidicola]|nr:hypothetical protein F4818DRAFT_457167 [Hypoxylon cercidicola]